MGFYLMIGSMLLGLFALKIGFSHLKDKKFNLSSILASCLGTALVLFAICLGTALVLFAIWLGLPK